MDRRLFLGQLASLPLLDALALGQSAKGAVEPNKPLRLGSEKQLFIDDLFLSRARNMALTMNSPVKTDDHCIVAEHPWEEFRVGAFNTVVLDGGLYKMWYEAVHVDETGRYRHGHCLATSSDGIQWKKPKVGLVEFRGSTENNVLPLLDTQGTVLIDPNGSGEERYRFSGWYSPPGQSIASLWLWSSADGLDWKRSDRPVLVKKRSYDTQNQIFWDDRVGRYVAYVRLNAPKARREPGGALVGDRQIGRSESPDLKQFSEPKVVFFRDQIDPWNSDHYNPCVVKYPLAASAYLMFPSAYYHYPESVRRNDGPLDIQLATSRDGIEWTRVDRRPYVGLGVDGSFDDSMLYMTVGMLQRGDELWMYYSGYTYTHGNVDTGITKRGVISRLVQRLDGFVSADAAYSGGEFETPPLTFEGTRLELNLDAGALGTARVEILDVEGRSLPGFDLRECDLIQGNHIRRTVTWKGS